MKIKSMHWRSISVHPAAIAFLLAAHSAASAQASAPKRMPEHIFAADSFWYQPIPKDAPLHPNSEGLARDFVRQLKAYYGNVSINTGRYSAPIYVVGPETRTDPVTQWDCQKRGHLDKRL